MTFAGNIGSSNGVAPYVTSKRQPIEGRGLPSGMAFSLLFLLPTLSVALAYWLVLGPLGWSVGDGAAGPLVVLFAPTLVTGVLSHTACSSIRVDGSTARSFVLGPIVIAVVLSLLAGATLVASGD